ncbi:rhomboid-related protein 2-like isoform X2 [Sitophilus oryzae]|uniref:Rhomboid-related protein 2-like isoform X2 n=1 Tax=Sitophilus oryzae TaxID=7048 RepID=A0A6J2XAC0_SITOR|nr:rhomboid-related protein 2-like isoform X2 [Sitophilus oryzae]
MATGHNERYRDREYYRRCLEQYDLDGSGGIEIREFIEMLRQNDEISEKIIKKLFKYGDKNKDKKITLDEFIDLVTDRKFSQVFGKYVNNYMHFILPNQKPKYKPTGRRAPRSVEEGQSEVDGPYEEEYSCLPPPIGMVFISIMEIIFFVIDEHRKSKSAVVDSGPMANLFIYNPNKRYEFWRFLTYMFVHIGYTHLSVNLIIQIFLGIPLELAHRWWRVLILYFLGVIAGSLLTSVMDPFCFLAGASGGVYALLTAHISTVIMNFDSMACPCLHLIIIIMLISVDVGSALYARYTATLDQTIGYVAHFGGAVAGLLVGIWMLRNVEVTNRENKIWWIALILYIFSMITLIAINIFWTSHFQKSL